MSSTVCVAFAAEAPDYTLLDGESYPELRNSVSPNVWTLVSGSDEDFFVGDGVLQTADEDPFFPEDATDRFSPNFKSGGYDHTHQYIVACALTVLANDLGDSILNTDTNSNLLLEGADYPDSKETSGIFAWHFYKPDTEKSFNGSKTTAKTKSVDYFNKAITEYNNGNISTAMSYIGRGTHYFEDVNEPHHASNLTAVGSNHGAYESYVDDNRFDYYIEGYTIDKSYYKQAEDMTIDNLIRSYAYQSNTLKDAVRSTKGGKDYVASAHACVENAIMNICQYYYKFGLEVGIYKKV